MAGEEPLGNDQTPPESTGSPLSDGDANEDRPFYDNEPISESAAAWGAKADQTAEPGGDDDPLKVLDAWTALEVLSPQTYSKPSDLAGGEARRVAKFDSKLPWEDGPERSRPNFKLYYHVVIGGVGMAKLTTELLKAFGDTRPEIPRTKDIAALAAVTVDKHGRPVEEDPISVSSFGWGYQHARQNNLEKLSEWPVEERRLIESLKKILIHFDDDSVRPLNAVDIGNAYRFLLDSFGLPKADCVPPAFAIRVYHLYFLRSDPDPLLLNSFFLKDLARAKQRLRDGEGGATLQRYLKIRRPTETTDLNEDVDALEALVSPAFFAPARWPSDHGSPLVLLQQAAVNASRRDLSNTSGLLAVNGPPGTGKTTLLRDIYASVIVERARALLSFQNPEDAFQHRGKFAAGGAFIHAYDLDPRLRGFEMLVASSNNRAVENISKEIPLMSRVNESRAPKYFRSIADNVHEGDEVTWGLAAAVLGNSWNRSKFFQRFWRDDDCGLKSYLYAAGGGTPNSISETDPDTGEITERPPEVILQEKPPASQDEARNAWSRAQARFKKALSASEKALREAEAIRQSIISLPGLRDEAERAANLQRQAYARLMELEEREGRLSEEKGSVSERLREHISRRPGFFTRIFRFGFYRDWRHTREELASRLERTVTDIRSVSEQRRSAVTAFERARTEFDAASARLVAAEADAQRAAAPDPSDRPSSVETVITHSFLQGEREAVHTSAPWLSAEAQRLRDECFKAAFELHRAFIDAAARRIRQNLMALNQVMLGRSDHELLRATLPSLWSTFFLVVPLVSTTFASVERMLGLLPDESLGWLFIDEAGQAAPQAAVGAIMRAKRAVIVGDPLQIEPVVTLPNSLVGHVCTRFGVEPEAWGAPRASVQTLADAASDYQTWLDKPNGAVRLGAPLWVHRRCAVPMFTVSNQVAYANHMVFATPARPDARIKRILGRSRWLHVESHAASKSSKDEIDLAVALVGKLLEAGLRDPDVYVISPFRVVAQGLRAAFQSSGLSNDIAGADAWRWRSDRIGTVHTFQGKEAEAVILVLGAPNAEQQGARNWAGSGPNLLNVSVSRAQEALYVIGNADLWAEAGAFKQLRKHLPLDRPQAAETV